MFYALFCSCREIQGDSYLQNQGLTALEMIMTNPLILPVGVGEGGVQGEQTCS